jgi:hypothetical protein
VSCNGSRVEANIVVAYDSSIATEFGTVSDLPYSMIKRLYGVASTHHIALATDFTIRTRSRISCFSMVEVTYICLPCEAK